MATSSPALHSAGQEVERSGSAGDVYRHLSYRRDIDGLRAIAIVSVVMFHAFPAALPGGFVGVDVFFVISGFLICGLIFASLNAGGFSFRKFYARRVRRIFPALALVLGVSFCAGLLFLLGSENAQLGSFIAAGAAFIANLVLWQNTAYFDTASAVNPLLHLWSLGVEEQFYLVWPLVLVVAWKLRANLLAVTLIVLIGSFALNVATVHSDPQSDFYSPFTRFWELQVGGSLAYALIFIPTARPGEIFREVLAWCGLACTVGAAVILSDQSPFPGWWALLPTVGTGLLLIAGPEAWLNRSILAHPVVVWIGLISYPLYLWHWPLLAFARVVTTPQLSVPVALAIVALSVGLAYLTYAYVERPIRMRNPDWRVVGGLCAAMAVVGVAGLLSYKGLIPARSQSFDTRLNQVTSDWIWTKVTFDGTSISPLILHGSTDRKVVFLGDSHMEMYSPRVRELYATQKPRLTSVFATTSGCPPLGDTHRHNYADYQCDAFYRASMQMASQPNVERVVFAAFWESWAGGALRGRVDQSFGTLQQAITGLVRSGKRVYIILPSPVSAAFVPQSLIGSRWKGAFSALAFEPNASVNRGEIESWNGLSAIREKLVAVARASGAVAIDPFVYVCSAVACPATVDGEPLYSDRDHLRATYVAAHPLFIDDVVLK